MKYLLILLLALISKPTEASAGEVSLFHKCFMHLTQTYPSATNPHLLEVKSGTKKAIEACGEILDRVSFSVNDNTMIPDVNNSVDVNLLRVFHNLHYSWFSTKFYPEIQDNYIRNMQNLYDASTPALYITRAMFAPGVDFSSVFRGDTTLLSIRRTEERVNSILQPHTSANDVLQGIKFTGLGDLLGVKSMAKNVVADVLTTGASGERIPAAAININTHWGGGVLGSQVYMIQNIQAASLAHRSDGGVNSNRKWSRSLFQDFFCRELPVVRSTDVDAYIVPASSLTYRNSRSCVQCHASLDPLAAVTRDARYDRRANFKDPNGAYAFLVKWNKTMPVASYFPSEPDNSFHLRPALGNFFMRTYDGHLVSKEIPDMDTLGDEILSLDDVYVCAAKRYFEYFTGINANISDIKDPMNPNFPSLSVDQDKYRSVVINLGQSFKQHKDLKRLVKDIMENSAYRSSIVSGNK